MWLRAAAGAVVAAMAFGAGWSVQGWRKDAGFADERATWSREQNRALTAALEAKHKHEQRAARAEKGFAHAQQEIEARAADHRALLAELRRLDAYAAGGGDDTAAACRDRAVALARLVREGAGLLVEGQELVRLREAELARDRAE